MLPPTMSVLPAPLSSNAHVICRIICQGARPPASASLRKGKRRKIQFARPLEPVRLYFSLIRDFVAEAVMAMSHTHRGPFAPAHRKRKRSVLWLPIAVFTAGLVGAALWVTWLLWPRWPAADMALDAPSLPITVNGVNFNIPPAAIRNKVQRKPGTQERVDLVFLWPSLEPPDPAVKAGPGRPRRKRDRPGVRHHCQLRQHPAADRALQHHLSALSRTQHCDRRPAGLRCGRSATARPIRART